MKKLEQLIQSHSSTMLLIWSKIKATQYKKACNAVGVGYTAMSRWVAQLKQEHGGITPTSKAMTQEQKRIQELEAKIKQIEWENDILKKSFRSFNAGQQQTIDLIAALSKEPHSIKPLCKLFRIPHSRDSRVQGQ